jgi:hypothetical protein
MLEEDTAQAWELLVTGAVAVDGTFTDIRVVRLDPGDFVERSRNGKRIYFSFTTRRADDVLDLVPGDLLEEESRGSD